MARNGEAKLYDPCRRWLGTFLKQKFKKGTITVLPGTDRVRLGSALSRAGLGSSFPESSAWEVKIDVAAVVQQSKSTDLVFVELKTGAINLRDVGQLLGYCRVCRPVEAFLLSPVGPSADLHRLLTAYSRIDVLRYDGQYMQVGRWLESRSEPAWCELLPGGVCPVIAKGPRRKPKR